MKFLSILNRAREPSTWAGISVLLTLAGVPAGIPEAVAQLVTAAAALAAVVLSERGKNA